MVIHLIGCKVLISYVYGLSHQLRFHLELQYLGLKKLSFGWSFFLFEIIYWLLVRSFYLKLAFLVLPLEVLEIHKVVCCFEVGLSVLVHR